MTTGTEQLRRDNTARVLRTLRRLGPATRAELAQRTGLAKATVGVIVTALEASGAVIEEAPVAGPRGRPGRPVALRPAAYLALGLELNVDYVSVVAVDLAGDVVVAETRPAADDREHVLVGLVDEVRARCPDAVLVGATVAVPALVRGDHRTVAWAPNLDASRSGLPARLEEALPGCVVRMSNDANCAAYAEAHHGAAVGVQHALYLTGTVGLGAGLVIDGELVRGGAGFAGEVGHMPVGDPDARCGCGRQGCWEASVGLHAVCSAAGVPEAGTPVQTALGLAARADTDERVRGTLARLGEHLGRGIATIANVLDPEVVVLGGYFVPLGDHVLGPARRVLDERLASPVQVRPELRLSTLGIEAASLGAAEESWSAVLSGTADLTGISLARPPARGIASSVTATTRAEEPRRPPARQRQTTAPSPDGDSRG